jgi:AP-2 complex subunit sigma-1
VPRADDAKWAIQVYAILDEVFLAGEIEETSKQVVLTRLEHLDKLE